MQSSCICKREKEERTKPNTARENDGLNNACVLLYVVRCHIGPSSGPETPK